MHEPHVLSGLIFSFFVRIISILERKLIHFFYFHFLLDWVFFVNKFLSRICLTQFVSQFFYYITLTHYRLNLSGSLAFSQYLQYLFKERRKIRKKYSSFIGQKCTSSTFLIISFLLLIYNIHKKICILYSELVINSPNNSS